MTTRADALPICVVATRPHQCGGVCTLLLAVLEASDCANPHFRCGNWDRQLDELWKISAQYLGVQFPLSVRILAQLRVAPEDDGPCISALHSGYV